MVDRSIMHANVVAIYDPMVASRCWIERCEGIGDADKA